VLNAAGSLLQKQPLRGQRHVALNLRDVGGGLLKIRVEVDGQRFSEHAVPDSRGTCKVPFVQPVPCPSSATVEVPMDTGRLTDGPHTVAFRVFDATGANSAVYGPVGIDVDNVADAAPRATTLACPAGTEGRMTRRLERKVTRFGQMTAVTGRVSGPALDRNARVTIIDAAGVRATTLAARVRQAGRFRIRLRPARSGRVRPVLLGASGQPLMCGAPIHVRVRAGVTFRVAPKRLKNGHAIRMSGRLLARPVPEAGKTVAIQARARGQSSWIDVTAIRADSTGRFSFRYRFRRTFQRTTYEFRAVSPRQRGYAYARGWSRIRRATVTP
jgi:hypothetical protein